MGRVMFLGVYWEGVLGIGELYDLSLSPRHWPDPEEYWC